MGRIIANIAISTAALGVCAICLVLLLLCWKKGENYKRTIYSSAEYATLVRSSFPAFLRYLTKNIKRTNEKREIVSTNGYYTMCPKNVSIFASYNFDVLQPILIIFGSNVATVVISQTALCFHTSPN